MISIFYPSHGILEIAVDKETSTKEFVKLAEHLSLNQTLPRCLNILLLAPEGFKEIPEEELSVIADSLKSAAKRYERINIAFTVSTIREIKLVTKFINDYQIVNFDLYPCQSIKEAKRKLRRLSLSIERVTYKYAV